MKTIKDSLGRYKIAYDGFYIVQPEGMRPILVCKGRPATYIRLTLVKAMLAEEFIKRARSRVKGVARYVKA